MMDRNYQETIKTMSNEKLLQQIEEEYDFLDNVNIYGNDFVQGMIKSSNERLDVLKEESVSRNQK